MKIRLHTPQKVSVDSLAFGDFFIKESKDGSFSQIYQKVTPPTSFGGYDAILDDDSQELFKPLKDFVYYVEVWCGWQYSYTKEEAENKMVYKVVPVTGALEVKLDLDVKLNVGN